MLDVTSPVLVHEPLPLLLFLRGRLIESRPARWGGHYLIIVPKFLSKCRHTTMTAAKETTKDSIEWPPPKKPKNSVAAAAVGARAQRLLFGNKAIKVRCSSTQSVSRPPPSPHAANVTRRSHETSNSIETVYKPRGEKPYEEGCGIQTRQSQVYRLPRRGLLIARRGGYSVSTRSKLYSQSRSSHAKVASPSEIHESPVSCAASPVASWIAINVSMRARGRVGDAKFSGPPVLSRCEHIWAASKHMTVKKKPRAGGRRRRSRRRRRITDPLSSFLAGARRRWMPVSFVCWRVGGLFPSLRKMSTGLSWFNRGHPSDALLAA